MQKVKIKKNPDMVTINQEVHKDIYKPIKMIAVEENRYVSEIVSDALKFYSENYKKVKRVGGDVAEL